MTEPRPPDNTTHSKHLKSITATSFSSLLGFPYGFPSSRLAYTQFKVKYPSRSDCKAQDHDVETEEEADLERNWMHEEGEVMERVMERFSGWGAKIRVQVESEGDEERYEISVSEEVDEE